VGFSVSLFANHQHLSIWLGAVSPSNHHQNVQFLSTGLRGLWHWPSKQIIGFTVNNVNTHRLPMVSPLGSPTTKQASNTNKIVQRYQLNHHASLITETEIAEHNNNNHHLIITPSNCSIAFIRSLAGINLICPQRETPKTPGTVSVGNAPPPSSRHNANCRLIALVCRSFAHIMNLRTKTNY